MRGWLVQQLAKLAIAFVAQEDTLVHADSDIVLIRPLREESLTDGDGAVRLYRIPGAIDDRLPNHVPWPRNAEQHLGSPSKLLPLPDYVGGPSSLGAGTSSSRYSTGSPARSGPIPLSS
jgi:hypothetical protein